MADGQQPNKRLKIGNSHFPNNPNPNDQASNPNGQASNPNGQASNPNGQASNPDGQTANRNVRFLPPEIVLNTGKRLRHNKIRVHAEPTTTVLGQNIELGHFNTVISKFAERKKSKVGIESRRNENEETDEPIPEKNKLKVTVFQADTKRNLAQKKKSTTTVAPEKEIQNNEIEGNHGPDLDENKDNRGPISEKNDDKSRPILGKSKRKSIVFQTENRLNLKQKKKLNTVVPAKESENEIGAGSSGAEDKRDAVTSKTETKQKRKEEVTKVESPGNGTKGSAAIPESNGGHDTVFIKTEIKPKRLSKKERTKTKALVPKKETLSFLQSDGNDPSSVENSGPEEGKPKPKGRTDGNTESKRNEGPASSVAKTKSLPLSQPSSSKSVKIVLEESIYDNIKTENGKTLPKKTKKDGKQKKKKVGEAPAEGSRAKVAILRLSNRRMSVGYRDVTEDPLEEDFIRRASTYTEWAKQAKGALPSKGGVELDEGMAPDLIHLYDTTKALRLNPNDKINTIRNEIRRRSTVASMGGSSRRLPRGTGTYFDFMQPLAQKSTAIFEDVDSENPERGRAGSVTDKRLQDAIDDLSSADRIAKLRNISAPLSVKRGYKKIIMEQANFERAKTNVTHIEKLKTTLSFYWLKIKSFMHDMKHSISALAWWKNDLKMIENTYGAETFVYFRWIRTIIFLNMMYTLTSFILLVLPELIHTGYEDFHKSFAELRVSDLFTGEGSFTHHYAKFYYNSFDPTPHQRYFGSSPFRFCLCLVLIFVINSIYIGYQVTYFYHSTRLETEIPGASIPNSIMELVCAWDHSISTPSAAKLRHQIIARDLRAMIAEIRPEEKEDSLLDLRKKKNMEQLLTERFGYDYAHWVIFWMVNCFSFCLSILNAAILYSLHDWRYYATVRSKKRAIKIGASLEDTLVADPNFFVFLVPSVYTLVSGQMYILYELHFSKFEGWKSLEKKLFAMLVRVGFFWICEISVMYVARTAHWKSIHENEICWEVTFGAEFYRLIVLQELINFIFTLILDGYPARKHSRNESYPLPVFDVNRHTLNIIYVHTISGMAFVYCPTISFVVVVRLIITYYHERNVLQNWTRCNETETNFRMSQIYVPYLTAMFISYIISSSLNVFLILQLETSGYCGPFSSKYYADSLRDAFGEISLFFIEVIASPGVNVAIISLMIAALFMMRAWGHAYHCKMILLHEFLDLEKQDRDFLMRAIYNIGMANQEDKQSNSSDGSVGSVHKNLSGTSTSSWKDALQNMVYPTGSASTRQKKKPSQVKDLESENILNLRPRRMTQAEAIFMASTDLNSALPHHAMHAHKAIDDYADLKAAQNRHHHASRPEKYFSSMYSMKHSTYDANEPSRHHSTFQKSVYDDTNIPHGTMSRASKYTVEMEPKKKKTTKKQKTPHSA